MNTRSTSRAISSSATATAGTAPRLVKEWHKCSKQRCRTGTPAASYFIPLFKRYRYLTPDHPLYRRISAQLTVAWVLMELAISGWEAWYLTQVTATEFVVLRHLIGWPIMAAWIFLLVFYLRFRLDPLDYVLGRRSSSLGRTDPLRYGDSVGHRA